MLKDGFKLMVLPELSGQSEECEMMKILLIEKMAGCWWTKGLES